MSGDGTHINVFPDGHILPGPTDEDPQGSAKTKRRKTFGEKIQGYQPAAQQNMDTLSDGELITVLGGAVVAVGTGYIVYRVARGAAGGAVIYFTAGAAAPIGWAIIAGP